MLRRLAPKLILAVAAIALVAKGFALWVDIRTQQAQLLESMTLGADQLSRSITSATWQAMLADRRDAAYEVMQTIAEKQGIDQIRMFNRDGHLMFSTETGDTVHLDQRAEVCAPCHSSETPLERVDLSSRSRVFREPDGRRTIAMITPIYNEPACSEADCHAHPAETKVLGVLDVTLDASSVDHEMADMRTRAALLTVVELGVIGVFLVVFTRRFVEKPIHKLTEATKAISEMQLDRPISIDSSEELQQLAHSFDVMRVRLRDSMAENAEFMQQLESKVEQRTAQLQAAQRKLIHADRLASLGQLSASVAHEINNPISGVLNLSMLMQRLLGPEGVPPGRLPEFQKYLGQITSETARVGRIVADLLAFSRRSRPQPTDADLNAIVRTTASLIGHKLALANITLDLDLAESLPLLRCDASQIQQVVINLVMNGAEAIRGGGRVSVRTRTSDDGSAVLFEVSDTGSGIPAELRDRIFDPFFTTKDEGKGVGLGLAVVYGIVDAHGGDIEVTSVPGQGSCFRVTLPRAAAGPASTPPITAAS